MDLHLTVEEVDELRSMLDSTRYEIRVPTNIVPLSPITMVRPPGWPLDQTSALKPDGSLILARLFLIASALGPVCGICGISIAVPVC